MNEQQEFITNQIKSAEAYKSAIKRMEGEIEVMLNGEPETYVKENGMPGFHEKFAEIKKIRYDICDAERRLQLCEESIIDAQKE